MLNNEDVKFVIALLILGGLIGMAISFMAMGVFDGFIYFMIAMIIGLVLTSTLYQEE